MSKLKNILAALVLSLASFLPFAGASVSAVGELKTTTITITDGVDYTVDEMGALPIILEEGSEPRQQITSGGTFTYNSNASGEHEISFGINFEAVSLYDLTDVKLNGVSVPATSLGEGRYKITMGEAASYSLGIFMTPKTGPTMHTVIWANPDVKDKISHKDMLINNGFAKVVGVYNEDGVAISKDTYSPSGDHPADGIIDGYGHIQALPGWKVVFEFTPVYGYQLVSVKANDVPLTPQETTNQYIFTMPNANIHFAADFAKTSDVVISGSEKVSSGTITLTKNILGAGTAQLSVNDVDLDAAKIADFDKAANGMTISDILDIDFYNVFFKGKADSSDVWSNQIHELSEEATITLKLGDDVDVSRVVIVHNIDDGDEYEIIKIDSYDAEAHTITFKTKSFSNFAIAIGAGSPNSGFVTQAGASATATIAVAASVATIIVATAWIIRKRTA